MFVCMCAGGGGGGGGGGAAVCVFAPPVTDKPPRHWSEGKQGGALKRCLNRADACSA